MTTSPAPTRPPAAVPPVLVRSATSADLARTADLHRHELPHGLFPRLGRGFVRRWHATFLDGGHGVALVAQVAAPGGPTVVGFLVGATDQRRHVAGVVRRHRLPLAVRGAAALAVRPPVLVHFLRTRVGSYARRLLPGRPAAVAAAAPPAVAVVTAVAVEPSAQGLGVGAALLREFVSRSTRAGASRADLATLAGPGGAGAFYERLGWELVRERDNRDGVATRTYRLDLREPVAAPTRAPSAADPLRRGAA